MGKMSTSDVPRCPTYLYLRSICYSRLMRERTWQSYCDILKSSLRLFNINKMFSFYSNFYLLCRVWFSSPSPSWWKSYICSPVLVPHMVGIALLPGAETPNVSTWQVPPFQNQTFSASFLQYGIWIHQEWRPRHCQCSRLCCPSLLTLKIVWLAEIIVMLTPPSLSWSSSD